MARCERHKEAETYDGCDACVREQRDFYAAELAETKRELERLVGAFQQSNNRLTETKRRLDEAEEILARTAEGRAFLASQEGGAR